MSNRLKLAADRAADHVRDRAVLRFRDARELVKHLIGHPQGEQSVVPHASHCITTQDKQEALVRVFLGRSIMESLGRAQEYDEAQRRLASDEDGHG